MTAPLSPFFQYADLFTVLKRENDRWVAELFEAWPVKGATPVARVVLSPIDYGKLTDPLITVGRPCKRAMKAHGRYLYEWLFRGRIADALRQRLERLIHNNRVQECLRVRLCFDKSFADMLEFPFFHWEALLIPEWANEVARSQRERRPARLPARIENPFLALNPSLSLVRQPLGIQVAADPAVAEPLRLMIIRCNPDPNDRTGCSDLEPHLTRLHEEVVSGLGPLRKEGLVDLVADLQDPSADDCLTVLAQTDPHAFIFLGHGLRRDDEYQVPVGGLVLRKGPGHGPFLSFPELVKVVHGKSLRLAVLIACHSSAAAPLLLEAGVPAALGMNLASSLAFPVRSARRFAEVFFRELAKFRPIEESLVEARAALAREGPQFPDWLIPTLWLASKDSRLFVSLEEVRKGQYLREVLRSHGQMRVFGHQESVPFERHYVEAGTWREIEKRPPIKAEAEQDPATRDQSIPGWLEAHERVMRTFENVDLLKALTDDRTPPARKRYYVWGLPGAGKTTMLEHLTTHFAEGALKGQGWIPVFIDLHALGERLLGHQNDPDAALRGFLEQQLQPIPDALSLLKKGDVVLFFDGMDEVLERVGTDGRDVALRQLVCRRLMAFANDECYRQCPIVITSRLRECPKELSGFTALEMKPFDDPKIQAYAEGYFRHFPITFTDGHADAAAEANRFIEALNQNPHLKALAGTPLLLSLICYLYRLEGLPLPAGQTQLFDRATLYLLKSELHRASRIYPEPLKRRVLEAIAFQVTACHNRLTRFHYGQFNQEAVRVLTDAEAEFGRTDLNSVLEDIVGNSGLLQRLTDGGYVFLHLSFQEYFAAGVIATGNAVRALSVSSDTLWNFVDKKAWDPDWEQFILFLAGKLADPTPLLELLTDEKKDDYFRCRLALAARCLPEIQPEIREQLSAIVDRIATDAFSLWWKHDLNNTGNAVSHLTHTLPALRLANGRIDGMPLLEWLYQRLCDKDRDVWWVAARAVGCIGSAADTPEIFACLLELLRDENADVRWSAAAGIAGSTAYIPGIRARLPKLWSALQCGEVPAWAEWMPLDIKSEMDSPEGLSHLFDILLGSRNDWGEFMRMMAAEELRRIMAWGGRIFVGRHGKWKKRSVAELSSVVIPCSI